MSLVGTLTRISFQDAIQYRAEAFVWFLYDFMPPLMMLFLWLAAFESQSTVGGFDRSTMLGYTLGTMVVRTLLVTHVEWAISEEVRLGKLSTHLVRPFNPWLFWFCDQIAWKGMRALLLLPVFAGCVVWLAPELGTPRLELSLLPPLVLAIAMGFVLSFFIKACIGFAAFWVTDVFGLMALFDVVTWIVGGTLIPIDLLPSWLQTFAAFLPFQYIYYLPLSIALGRMEAADAWRWVALEAGWTVVMGLLAYSLWRRGLVRYEAVGG